MELVAVIALCAIAVSAATVAALVWQSAAYTRSMDKSQELFVKSSAETHAQLEKLIDMFAHQCMAISEQNLDWQRFNKSTPPPVTAHRPRETTVQTDNEFDTRVRFADESLDNTPNGIG